MFDPERRSGPFAMPHAARPDRPVTARLVIGFLLFLAGGMVLAQEEPTWALEETFDGDPASPSQALLPENFEFVATHRSHPQEQFTKLYPPFLADHDLECRGPDPAIMPTRQHEVRTTQTSNGDSPDASFFICRNHMMSSMGQVDPYSNSLFWPMQEFDFSDGGVLEFDVNVNEGHTQRMWWEVLIAPREQVRFAPAPLQSAVDETYPADRIVLDFRNLVRQIRVGTGATAPDGWIAAEREFATYDFAYWEVLHPDDPALSDRRIRRTMRIEFEADRITWGIQLDDGSFDTFSLDVPGGLPFTRGLVQFKTHAYTPQTSGNNVDTYTFHWDNIRFDGPVVGKYEAYRAQEVVYLQRNGSRPIGDTQTVQIDMPEIGSNPVLVGQINASLRGQPLLSINGGPDIAVEIDEYPIADCVSGEWRDWISFRLPLDPAWLQPGPNSFRWTVGPRPDCAAGQSWWDGFSVKSLQVQVDVASGAGRVPNGADLAGAPLRMTRSGDALTLDWAPSCNGDNDYAVYAGSLGSPQALSSVACSTSGQTELEFTPSADQQFFLVVPQGADGEGSYGVDSLGQERQPSPTACRPQRLAVCSP